MLAMPLLGAWFVAVIPEDSRGWIMGGSMTMTMFLSIAAGASVLIGGYAVIGLWKQHLYINGATATLLAALAFGATAGGEFVREGVRKPYSVRETLFSNATTPGQIASLRRTGIVPMDPYPVQDAAVYPHPELVTGRLVYRNLCSACHTVRGTNGLVELLGGWTDEQKRMNVAMLQWTKGFMPPFAGTAGELEALVQYLDWEHGGRPAAWTREPSPVSIERIERIEAWLDEAGTLPAPAAQRGGHR
jgi:mono/diheme cytochrome c family protein